MQRPTSSQLRKRMRKLTVELFASPTLPALGWTKAVETVIAGGPTINWLIYATIITGLWVGADAIKRYLSETAEEVAEQAAEAAEEVRDTS